MMRFVAIPQNGLPEDPVVSWPVIAADVASSYATFYDVIGHRPPWIGYLAVVGDECVGTCGFKGPPVSNRVEIAYFTFPDFEGRGMATEMARHLIAIAREGGTGLIVAAQTLPLEGASTRILRKLGFEHVATVDHDEDGMIWEWQLAAAEVDL